MSTSEKQTASSATQPSSTATRGFSLLSAIARTFKVAGLSAVVWLWGYAGFSCAWLLVALFFHVINEEYRKIKDSKKAFAKHLLENEKGAILSKLDEYPSWVHFPEAEKAAWFNKILIQMWPYIGDYVQELMRTNIQQTIRASLPSKFQNFSFETIDLGDTAPAIDHVVVYQDMTLEDEIVCDVEFRYRGDAHIRVNASGISAGIQDISVSGKMRALMKPLVPEVPIIGAVTVFFLDKPNVTYNLTGAANLLDFPGFSQSLRGIVDDQVARHLVLPNRIVVQLVPDVDMSKLKHPVPKGVIHLFVIGARNLADKNCDPYCIIQVGTKVVKTKVVKDSMSPVWNEHFEVIIDQTFGQHINITVKDEDINKDDLLGVANLNVETIVKKRSVDAWQQLEGVTTGSIHVQAIWFHLCTDIQEMNKRRDIAIKTRKTAEETLSCAVLLFVLEEASDVTRSDKPGSLYNLFARITVGHDTQNSSVQYETNKPRWDEKFLFFVDDPEKRAVTVELCSAKDKVLGFVSVPINTLLTVDNMTAVKQLAMPDISPTCTLTARLVLRIMTQKECETSDNLLLSNVTNNNVEPTAE